MRPELCSDWDDLRLVIHWHGFFGMDIAIAWFMELVFKFCSIIHPIG